MSEHRTHEAVIDTLIHNGLLQPRPRKFGLTMIALLIPAAVQAIGLCCFGIVAFSLTEMGSLPYEYRISLVIAGSFAAAIGGDIGTLPSAFEVFRKRRRRQIEWSDWAALIISALASATETIIALSFLGGFNIADSWLRIGTLGLLSVADAYFTISEAADWYAMYEERMEQWQKEYKKASKQGHALGLWDDIGPTPKPQPEPESEPETNGAGLCWCGMECRNRQSYAAHVQHDHYPEIAEYSSGVAAQQEMQKKYAATIPDARWEFPALEWFNRVRERGE